MEFTHRLLINILAMFIVLFLLQQFSSRQKLRKLNIQWGLFIALNIFIIICMTNPFKVQDGHIFDLRFIPLAIGSLYGNRFIRMWIIFAVLVMRLSYGLEYAWFPICNIFIFYFLCILMYSRYHNYAIKGKLLFITILTLFFSIWSLAGVRMIFHTPITLSFASSYALIQSGGIFIISWMMETIQKQELLLKKLIRVEKIESISHMAASISHEIRNPLTTARGFMQLLGESLEIPEKQKEYISYAINEIDRADSIIRDYLTFAKPTQENIEVLDIKKEIEQVTNIMEPLASINGVHIVTNVKETNLSGNSGLFQQALVNIIKNGIEAMSDGGRLEVQAMSDDSTVKVVIKDEGIGMSHTQTMRLGEPYFSTKDTKGTGLGMMVVFRIIENMGGIIKIDSTVGKGTSVILTFPKKLPKSLAT